MRLWLHRLHSSERNNIPAHSCIEEVSAWSEGDHAHGVCRKRERLNHFISLACSDPPFMLLFDIGVFLVPDLCAI